MLIFWEQRLVILAVPKTGTTALENVLSPLATIAITRPPHLKHTGVWRYRRSMQKFLEREDGQDFTVVAQIREPLSWLGSWYRYRCREESALGVRSTRGISFGDFLQGCLSDPPPAFAAIGSQSEFLSGGRKPGPDRVFAYEKMPVFLAYLEERLQMPVVLPVTNASPKMALDADPGIIEAVRERYAADFALHAQALASC